MPAQTVIQITHGAEAAQSVADVFAQAATAPREAVQALSSFLASVAGGVKAAKVTVNVESLTDTVAASATATITHANLTAGDTITIGGVVLTANTDFAIGANATADATNLAAAVNAHASLKGLITATSAAGVVTFTFFGPGRLGNLITLATSDATAFALSAARLGGAASTQTAAPRTYSLGVA